MLDVDILADFLAAEKLPQHVAEFVILGFLRRDGLVFNQSLRQRMIDGELIDRMIADSVNAAIADAGDEHPHARCESPGQALCRRSEFWVLSSAMISALVATKARRMTARVLGRLVVL